MNFSRQALLGIGMILGGSVMLYAMAQQIGASEKQSTEPVMIVQADATPATSAPLTTDIDTEKRILAQKQKERAARVVEQEKRAQQFLAEQEAAETQALAKARTENQRYIDNTTPALVDTGGSDSPEAAQNAVATPQVQPRVDTSAIDTVATALTTTSQADDEAKKAIAKKQAEDKKQAEAIAKKTADLKKKADVELAAKKKAAAQIITDEKAEQKAKDKAAKAKREPPKSATDYTVKRGDGLIKLAREYNVPVAALAQANNTSPSASLQLGQTLVIPSRKQIQRLEREAAAEKQARESEKAQAKKSAETKREAQQKLREARKEVKETDAKGDFGVQVALAGSQASADEVAKKFKAAGYKVKTSNTSRGVRVIVGPERGKIAALALKDKVNSDPKVGVNGAWVRYW